MKQTKQFYREIGSKGGKVKTKKGFAWLTPEERSENARRAVLTRWGRPQKPPPQRILKLRRLQAEGRKIQAEIKRLKALIAAAKEAK